MSNLAQGTGLWSELPDMWLKAKCSFFHCFYPPLTSHLAFALSNATVICFIISSHEKVHPSSKEPMNLVFWNWRDNVKSKCNWILPTHTLRMNESRISLKGYRWESWPECWSALFPLQLFSNGAKSTCHGHSPWGQSGSSDDVNQHKTQMNWYCWDIFHEAGQCSNFELSPEVFQCWESLNLLQCDNEHFKKQ